MAPLPFVWQLAAFIIFRFFDIVKPWPINFFDEKIKNGFGVMWDDMVAAIYTLFVIAIAVRVFWM
jgi:phosphatidylglycerophosphatase A